MKQYFENRKSKFIALIIILSCLILLLSGIGLKNSISFAISQKPFSSPGESPENKTNEYFKVIGTRAIDTQPMDDQMLEELSPALVAPVTEKITALQLKQRLLNEYNHSICFERCHTQNDFSASDYTYEQWRSLIEKDGHSIFSEISWENPEMKNDLFKYLVNNAKNATSEPEGIGVWNHKKDSFLVDSYGSDK